MRLSRLYLVTSLLLGLVAGSAFAQKTQLLVYTALETDQLKAYQEAFNKVEPNIEIKWVRDSTGVITAKLLAEKSNPQADVVMGVAASSLALLDKQGNLINQEMEEQEQTYLHYLVHQYQIQEFMLEEVEEVIHQ